MTVVSFLLLQVRILENGITEGKRDGRTDVIG